MRYHLYTIRLFFRRQPNRLCLMVANHLPHRLIYWCAIRVVSKATTGQHENQVVPDLTAMDALKRWGVY